jgi:hypothetical protein
MLIIRTLPRLDALMSPLVTFDVDVRPGEYIGGDRPPAPRKYRFRPVDVSDPIWMSIPRWVRIEGIDTLKGRTLEHVRR